MTHEKFFTHKTTFCTQLTYFYYFIMVNKLFSEKHTESTRPHMRTFDTADESLDPI
eukprot:UN20982